MKEIHTTDYYTISMFSSLLCPLFGFWVPLRGNLKTIDFKGAWDVQRMDFVARLEPGEGLESLTVPEPGDSEGFSHAQKRRLATRGSGPRVDKRFSGLKTYVCIMF